MRVQFLGTGTSYGVPMIGCDCEVCRSSDPRNKRARASILIEEQGANLLVDVTPDFRMQALRSGMRRLDAVVLTHSHADHIIGMDDIRAFSTIQLQSIPVYGDRLSLKQIRAIFAYAFKPPPGAQKWDVPHLELVKMPGPLEICGMRVTPVPIHHGRRMINAYRIRDFVYMTDCSGIPENSIPLLAGVDTLVIGAIRHLPHPAHFTLAQALEVIGGLKPRRAFITHISHKLGHAETDASLPEHVRMAYDGLQIEV